MYKSLFIFTITPVQKFISSVRKTQDFYAGSYLLSHLCKTALETAKNKEFEVVFPNETQEGIPNKFVCITESIENQEKKNIAKEIEQSVFKEINHIGKTIVEKIGVEVNEDFYVQLKNYFKMYWVFEDIKENYKQCYKKLIEKLSAIKALKNFKQINEAGRKCSMFPEFNALIGTGKKAFISDKFTYLPKNFGESNLTLLEGGECLSAIGFLKRFLGFYFDYADYDNMFFSTSKIAALGTMKKLLENNELEKKYYKNIGNDYELVFDLKEKKIINKKNYSTLKIEAAEKIIDKINDKNKVKISPYYAIVKFDGDNMGKIYSEPDLKEDKIEVIDFQKRLSEELCDFAKESKKEINESYSGKVIYAGGEDFMGLLTLDSIFEKIKKLREKFRNLKSSTCLHKNLTFSAGIVIAHYKTPLSEAIKVTETMENKAKRIDVEKDAFGIAVLKHSGEIVEGVLKFETSKGESTIEMLEYLITKLAKYEISKSLMYKISKEFDLVVREGEDVSPYLGEMIEARIGAYLEKNEKTKDSQEFTEILSQIKKLFIINRGNEKSFFDILSIVAFLAREKGGM